MQIEGLIQFHAFMATKKQPVQIDTIKKEFKISTNTAYRRIKILNNMFGAIIYHNGSTGYVMEKTAEFPAVFYGV